MSRKNKKFKERTKQMDPNKSHTWTVRHCSEGKCTHMIYKNFPMCKYFRQLVREGKNPRNCPYYDVFKDYEEDKK